MIRHRSMGLTLAACLAAAQASAAVIYDHNFSGVSGPLNGVAVGPTAAAWQAGPAFLDDGTVQAVVSGSPTGQAAHLPFTPQAGQIYTLTARITNPNPDWIAVGFMPGPAPGGSWTATAAGMRHSNSGAHAWALVRTHPTNNDTEGFNGINTMNSAFGHNSVPTGSAPVDFKIVLNTTAATWTAEYYLNGAQQGGVFNLPATANTGIGGVGFSRTNNPTQTSGGTIHSFRLEVVPEPATAVLGLGSLVGCIALTRRGRK